MSTNLSSAIALFSVIFLYTALISIVVSYFAVSFGKRPKELLTRKINTNGITNSTKKRIRQTQ